jgi:hypothetical protein
VHRLSGLLNKNLLWIRDEIIGGVRSRWQPEEAVAYDRLTSLVRRQPAKRPGAAGGEMIAGFTCPAFHYIVIRYKAAVGKPRSQISVVRLVPWGR